MKKIVLLTFFVSLTALRGFSQIEKGSILLGGGASASLSTLLGSNISISPNVGYFVTKRFCPGISTLVSYEKYEQTSRFTLALTPFTRYYFGVKEKRSFYGLASVSLAPIFVSGNVACSLGLGHVWFLNKNVGFEAQLTGFTFEKQYGLSTSFGLQIYLNGKKKEVNE